MSSTRSSSGQGMAGCTHMPLHRAAAIARYFMRAMGVHRHYCINASLITCHAASCVRYLAARHPKSGPDEVGRQPRSRFHECPRLIQDPSRCEGDVGVLGGGTIVVWCCSILALKALYELLSTTGTKSLSKTKTRDCAVDAGVPSRWCTAVMCEHQFATLRSSRPFSPHSSDEFPRLACEPLINLPCNGCCRRLDVRSFGRRKGDGGWYMALVDNVGAACLESIEPTPQPQPALLRCACRALICPHSRAGENMGRSRGKPCPGTHGTSTGWNGAVTRSSHASLSRHASTSFVWTNCDFSRGS